MKAHMQFGLLKLADPRVVRVLLIGLTLGLMLLAGTGVVYAEPINGNGGCGGGSASALTALEKGSHPFQQQLILKVINGLRTR